MISPSISKIPAFVLIMRAEKYAFTPPQSPPPSEKDRKAFGNADTITRSSSWAPFMSLVSKQYDSASLATESHGDTCCQGIIYITHICEIAAIIAHEYPSPTSSRILSFLLDTPSSADRLAISPSFVVGFLFLLIGGGLRKACYDILGRFFTYQLGILKDHKLITTGPYSVVRHPAYTAFFIAVIGLLIIQLGPGSYLFESGAMTTRHGATLTLLWVLWVLLIVSTALRRPVQEDEVLRKQFGKEWDDWAKKTPYKLIPCVY